MHKWTNDEIDDLSDNYSYYLNNKDYAVIRFKSNWHCIEAKASSIKCVIYKTNKSNKLILNELRSYIDGLMLSDGYLEYKGRFTGRYRQTCVNIEWLNSINNCFSCNNILCNIDNGKFFVSDFSGKCSSTLSYLYQLCTGNYVEFRVLRDKWYVRWYDTHNCTDRLLHYDEDGELYMWKKVIPKDIAFTSDCLCNFYLGDGSFNISRNKNVIITLLCYDNESREFISDLLNNTLDIKSRIDKRFNLYLSNERDVRSFFDYIKDCEIPSCYDYKFPKKFRGL